MTRVTEEADEDELRRRVYTKRSSPEGSHKHLTAYDKWWESTYTKKLPRPMAKVTLAQIDGREKSAGEATVLPMYT